MRRINPEILHNERKTKGWSLKDLEKRSGVDQQSIHRIERGGKRHNRDKVIADLARALGITEEVLTGTGTPLLPDKKMAELEDFLHQSQLNLRISDCSRNALALVAHRYRLKQSQIVEIAPFLFLWLAEKSLRRRQLKVEEMERKYSEMAEVGCTLPHLHGVVYASWRADSILDAEKKSIQERDLFAERLGGEPDEDIYSSEFNEWNENPMAMLLLEMAEELGSLAEFEHWVGYSSPDYKICRDEAISLVGGDEEAAEDILKGTCPLHRLPTELKQSGKEKERAAWVRAQAQARSPAMDIDIADIDLSETSS